MFMFRTNKQKQLDHQQCIEEGPVQLYLPWWAGILEYIGSHDLMRMCNSTVRNMVAKPEAPVSTWEWQAGNPESM